jgi:hypothetical protein
VSYHCIGLFLVCTCLPVQGDIKREDFHFRATAIHSKLVQLNGYLIHLRQEYSVDYGVPYRAALFFRCDLLSLTDPAGNVAFQKRLRLPGSFPFSSVACVILWQHRWFSGLGQRYAKKNFFQGDGLVARHMTCRWISLTQVTILDPIRV